MTDYILELVHGPEKSVKKFKIKYQPRLSAEESAILSMWMMGFRAPEWWRIYFEGTPQRILAEG